MTAFAGLSVALSSLYAQQRAIDVTGQNIANANTDGYSRQRVNMQALANTAVPAIWASSVNATGNGVEVTGVQRLRDMFLESQAQAEHGQQAYLNGKQTTLSQVEQTFNEPSPTGLQSNLAQMWTAFGDVANAPGDLSARNVLLQRATTVTSTLNAESGQFAAQWANQHDSLSGLVDSINSTAANIATLNKQIVTATQAGQPANDLMDQRDAAVVKLSEMAGIQTRAGAFGSVDVSVGGSTLVSGSTAQTLQLSGGGTLSSATTTPVALSWTSTGTPVSVSSGKAASLLESLNTTLPGYSSQLDGIASQIASSINAVQTAGYALDGSAGQPMFTGTTASTISVSLTDPAKVAASGVASATGNLDGTNADAMAALGTSPTGPDAAYRKVVSALGVAAQSVNNQVSIQDAVTSQVDASRDSESGVNIDEEMTNLIQYQRGYQSAARLMTTIDSVLDTLINHTGMTV